MADQTLDAKGPELPAADPEGQEGADGDARRAPRSRCWPPIPARSRTSQAFSRTTGHELIEQSIDGNVFRFVLKRKA